MAQSVFSGNQWTTASGSSWAVVIEPDFVNSVRFNIKFPHAVVTFELTAFLVGR